MISLKVFLGNNVRISWQSKSFFTCVIIPFSNIAKYEEVSSVLEGWKQGCLKWRRRWRGSNCVRHWARHAEYPNASHPNLLPQPHDSLAAHRIMKLFIWFLKLTNQTQTVVGGNWFCQGDLFLCLFFYSTHP